MHSIPQSEVKAIANLLKSSDINTLKLVEEQLKTFNIKTLKEINDKLPLDDIEARRLFSSIVLKIKREGLKEDFKDWSKNNSNDLESGAFLIASFSNPFLSSEQYSETLNSWRNILSVNLKKIKLQNDPTSIINEINHFMFMELGFKGNKEFYYDTENSFIDKVIDKRLGNPILLSIIYLLLTTKLELPFSGVNMPAHFLIQYLDAFEPIFIDPFNQGEIITKTDCKEKIKTLKLVWQEDYLSSPTIKQIILRIMQNLINIYHSEGQLELKGYFESYVSIIGK